MKLPQWIAMFLTVSTCINIQGQDTISIFFKLGIFKISDSGIEKLNAIPILYDLSDLDSVHFLGMADSSGSFISNIKLSEKRARNVARYCKRIFPSIPTKITALGERTEDDIDKNRRVDLILYFQPTHKEEVEHIEDCQIKEVCYNIDYELLHRSQIRTVIKRKKELTIIETSIPDLRKKKEHYYGSTSESGEFIANKVKWTSKRTGNLWWTKTRYLTFIPKEDFDNYKIFMIKDLPCDTCNEDFQNKRTVLKEDTCIQVDRFLMENIQFKTIFFNNNWIKIRAPKEYVNIEDRYFIACDFQSELIWETKKRKRNKNYYYSRLPTPLYYISNITRVMDCCKNNPEPSECDIPMTYFSTLGEPDRSLIVNAEIGSHHLQSEITPYTGIGISKEGSYSRVNLVLGTDINKSFYSSLRYQYHFFSFPFSMFNPLSNWQSPTEQKIIYKYGRLYIGTEINTKIHENEQNSLEHNIHLGLAAVNTKRKAFISRIFVQYGIGINYLGTNSIEIYPIFQVGIHLNLVRFNKKQ